MHKNAKKVNKKLKKHIIFFIFSISRQVAKMFYFLQKISPDRRPPLRRLQREDRQVRRLGRGHVHHRPERAVHHRLRVRLLRHLRPSRREGGGPLRGGGVRLAEVWRE